MHRHIGSGLLLLAAGLWITAASGAETWDIAPQKSCVGLTAGWARPLPELSKLVGPQWKPAPGPVKGQGLVLLFLTACPDSSYAGKATGRFSGAFVLVPVEQNTPAGAPPASNTHGIAVLEAAGKPGTPVMKLFRSHDIPISDARVSLDARGNANGKHAKAVIHFAQGTLTLDAEMLPEILPYKSVNTVAVRVTPAGVLFSGPESSTRYAKGEGKLHTSGETWAERYQLEGAPVFVTLDTDFIWNFAFQTAPHS
ncbi:MAG: hypothetical protein WCC11_04970 [Gammaproteobacteria bacterium]